MKKKLSFRNKLILLSIITQSTTLICMQSKEAKIIAKIEKRRQQRQSAQFLLIEKSEEVITDCIDQKEKEEQEKIDQLKIVAAKTKQIIQEVEQTKAIQNNGENYKEPVTIIDNPRVKKNKLWETRIVTPAPTKNNYPYYTYQLRLYNERDLFMRDLESNVFDADNREYHIILNRSINDFVDNNEHEKLTKTLKLIYEKYYGKIKPEDIPTVKAHEYLNKTHTEKLETLKTNSTTLNKDYIAKLNSLLSLMQKEFISYTTEANNIMESYKQNLQRKIESACIDIRESKEALLRVHQLNRTFVLGDEYCSDEENHPHLIRHKAVKNPDAVGLFYDDIHILKKIGVDVKSKNTSEKMQTRLATFAEINKKTQTLSALTYIEDKNNKHGL